MLSKSFLLHQISGFQNNKHIIVADQSTGDIIKAIIDTHPKYKDDYNTLSKYFKGTNELRSCEKIWNFLKKNIRYVIESEKNQIVRSPSAILKQGVSDCKCYALFAGGLCDALGMNFCYRFASYNQYIKDPGHVFVVVNPGTQNEIWIDPVLSYFNYKKPYYYKIDKKPKMAIYSISGIGATKAQRMARRTKRRAAGKGFGQKLKKGLKGVLKIAAAPARNAFLALVQLNVHNLAKKLAVAYQKNPTGLKHFWEQFGGRIDKLVGAINRGKKKKRILGVEPGYNAIGVVDTGVYIASAAPILVKVAEFLKKIGIEPKDLVELGKKAINAKAKQLIENQLIPQAETEQQYEDEANQSIES
jgi:hypothetical protein